MKQKEVTGWLSAPKHVDPDDSYSDCLYDAKCPKCGQLHSFITQRDYYPEYEARIEVKCVCGNWILLSFPVN